MTKRIAIPYKDVKLRIVGPTGEFMASRVQRLDIPVNLPNTVINELGNPGHAGTIVDTPEVTATFQAFDVSHKIFSYLTGTDPTAYPANGVDVSELGYVDLIGYVKEENVAEHLKCLHARYMRITDFTFTYSIDGESTEEYTCAGSEKRYLKYDAWVDKGALAAGVLNLTMEPKTLRNGNKLISCIVDGAWKEEGTDYSVTGSVLTVSGATTEYCLAVYHTQSGVMAWTDIGDSTIPIAIKGKNIPITIGTEHQYRVQSVTLRGTFPNTKVQEMGSTSILGYIVDPCNVTGDITVLDTDNELVALLSTGAKAGDAVGEYNPANYGDRTLALEIQIKNPADNVTIVKTVYIPKMRVTSDGTSSNVGGQLTQTFGFTSDDAQCVVYSGDMP